MARYVVTLSIETDGEKRLTKKTIKNYLLRALGEGEETTSTREELVEADEAISKVRVRTVDMD